MKLEGDVINDNLLALDEVFDGAEERKDGHGVGGVETAWASVGGNSTNSLASSVSHNKKVPYS